MNKVFLIGRLTKDPEVKTGQSGKVYCRMYIAINRGKDKDGEDLGADFPAVLCFGKTAENCERFLRKGSLVSVEGRVRTSKNERNGKTEFSQDIFIDHIEFLADFGEKQPEKGKEEQLSGFEKLDDDELPFN